MQRVGDCWTVSIGMSTSTVVIISQSLDGTGRIGKGEGIDDGSCADKVADYFERVTMLKFAQCIGRRLRKERRIVQMRT